MAKNRITFTDDFVLKNEKVGIGTTDPTATLTVIGDTNISGVVTASSFSGTIVGNVSVNNIGLIGAGETTLTTKIANQAIDSYPSASFLSSRYNISIACTGQLTGSYETPSTASVASLVGGQFYIPGTYYNIPLTSTTGVGTDGRINATVDGTTATVGITSAYNVLVTTSAHGIGTGQPVSFASSILRAEYVTLVENDILYTPVAHGIGTSEAVSFGSSIFDSSYTGIAVTAGAGTTYYATGTGSTSFTIESSIGGGQITGIGTTTFADPGNRVSFSGYSVDAGTIYYATGTGTTTFTLTSESTGIGTVVGIAISTGLSIGATISGGVSSVQVVFPGSSYAINDIVGISTGTLLNSVVGTGFSFTINQVSTNRQSNDFSVIAANSGVDYIESMSFATNTYLGAVGVRTSGSNTELTFNPYFKNLNIKYTRNSIER